MKLIIRQMVTSTCCIILLGTMTLGITSLSQLGVILWKLLSLVVFLESGKTTTLNHLITEAFAHELKPAVIMNEFGKMSVDGQLVRPDAL
ncbi:hypothetical protein JHX96_06160 [Staphylococcus saccharolyticus]|nr:hypothetical protein [Staphylococcus saccharolyticus]MBL7584928.1 hypothetical protein [Staphylococcus saccharolyticus]MBL7639150.1 hypothetical protein [Staphylococcus saccharolyticus]QRJ68478.1 hypothetical protein DMB75_000395 [Staphylococcus saccharolyticus]